MAEKGLLKQKFAQLWPHLDERARRIVAASEAAHLGYGGVSQVSRACGLSRVTLTKAVRELMPNRSPLDGFGALGQDGRDS